MHHLGRLLRNEIFAWTVCIQNNTSSFSLFSIRNLHEFFDFSNIKFCFKNLLLKFSGDKRFDPYRRSVFLKIEGELETNGGVRCDCNKTFMYRNIYKYFAYLCRIPGIWRDIFIAHLWNINCRKGPFTMFCYAASLLPQACPEFHFVYE